MDPETSDALAQEIALYLSPQLDNLFRIEEELRGFGIMAELTISLFTLFGAICITLLAWRIFAGRLPQAASHLRTSIALSVVPSLVIVALLCHRADMLMSELSRNIPTMDRSEREAMTRAHVDVSKLTEITKQEFRKAIASAVSDAEKSGDEVSEAEKAEVQAFFDAMAEEYRGNLVFTKLADLHSLETPEALMHEKERREFSAIKSLTSVSSLYVAHDQLSLPGLHFVLGYCIAAIALLTSALFLLLSSRTGVTLVRRFAYISGALTLLILPYSTTVAFGLFLKPALAVTGALSAVVFVAGVIVRIAWTLDSQHGSSTI